MPSIYDSADIYLNSPDLDNFPNSIMESFAAGLPVVTTDAGGIPYLISQEVTGFLVGIGDHEAMAESALRLLDDQELANRIARQALKECDKYSASTEQVSWVEAYQKLASEDLFVQRTQVTLKAASLN